MMTALCRFLGRDRSLRPQTQQVGQRQAANAQSADLEEGTAGHAITELRASTEERQHGGTPERVCRQENGRFGRQPEDCPLLVEGKADRKSYRLLNEMNYFPDLSRGVDSLHRRTVRSQLPVASVRPSGAKATEDTLSLWSLSVAMSWPPGTSHKRTVPS